MSGQDSFFDQVTRYFSDAARVLIMLHNDPDPDAMASGLALRSALRRTRSTAKIGAFRGTWTDAMAPYRDWYVWQKGRPTSSGWIPGSGGGCCL